jgi:streptogramin lyase
VVWLVAGTAPAAAAVGTITEYPVLTANIHPRAITLGPDGNMWVTEDGKVAKVTTAGVVTEYPIPSGSISYGITAGWDGFLWLTEYGGQLAKLTTAGSFNGEFAILASANPTAITVGPDGNLYVLEANTNANKVAKVSPVGTIIAQYSVPTTPSPGNPQGNLWGIALGSDNNLWFTETTAHKVAKVTIDGVFTEYPVPSGGSPFGITLGPDGNLWVTEQGTNKIASVTTSGVFTEYSIPTASSTPAGITQGPDGNLWFTEQDANKVASVTTAGGFTEYTIPTATSAPWGIALGNDGSLWFAEQTGNKVGNVQPTAQAAPGAPTGVGAAAGVGSANVTWTAPTAIGGSAITGYTVYSSAGASLAVPATSTHAVISGLSGSPHTFTVRATNASGTGAASIPTASVTPSPGGTYHALTPGRVLDTRTGIGAPVGMLQGGTSLNVVIAGQQGVPTTHVSAVVLNVTVTGPTVASYLTVYPTGGTTPTVSNLNFVANQTVPNLVEVALGAGGSVSFFNAYGAADVIADVQGWVGDRSNSWMRDGLFNALSPQRILDTRSGNGAPAAKLGPNQILTLQVSGRAGVPASGVSALVMNVTVTNPTAASYLTIFPTGATQPVASNLNFTAGQTVPNRVMVGLGTGGQVNIFNKFGSVDVIADVNAWFTDTTGTAGGAAFVGFNPIRQFDSRQGSGPLCAQCVYFFQVSNATIAHSALVLNTTVTNATAPSYLTLYPDNTCAGTGPTPLASDVNFVAGQTVPNLTVVALNQGTIGCFDVFNSAGSVDIILDEDGYYGPMMPVPPASQFTPTQLTFDGGNQPSRLAVPLQLK